MKNLAPEILRKRLVIEGLYKVLPSQEKAREYLVELASLLNMEIVHGPFVGNWSNQAKPEIHGGWEAYAIWSSSGVHMYSWERKNLITVDIYTCKDFSVEKAVAFTNKFFDLLEIVYKEN